VPDVLPGWHPIVAHFAVALSVSGAAALWGARLIRASRAASMLAVVGTWNFGAGAIAILVALGTGIGAIWNLHLAAAARAAVNLHVKWAFFTALAVLLLAVWRIFAADPDSKPSWLFLILISGAVAAVLVTGFHGGENVYRYGIGVLAKP
jgi:uncharacterized membrane protein